MFRDRVCMCVWGRKNWEIKDAQRERERGREREKGEGEKVER